MARPEAAMDWQAWVAFTGKTDLRILRLLKPGFRHCLVILFDGRHWLSIDPLSNRMHIVIHPVTGNFDIATWLAKEGFAVVKADMHVPETVPMPWGIMSCVSLVKRILGIRKPLIVTPWQLYKYLINQGKAV